MSEARHRFEDGWMLREFHDDGAGQAFVHLTLCNVDDGSVGVTVVFTPDQLREAVAWLEGLPAEVEAQTARNMT